MNPLLIETWRGLGNPGAPQRTWLAYLAVQAVVVFAWWPQREMVSALTAESGPDTLLAALISFGAASAYYSLRIGTEELLLPGQQALREWALATPLGAARILRGFWLANSVLLLHAVLLVAPLLVVARIVDNSSWTTIGYCLLCALLQASCYRLVGAVTYLAIGHRGDLTLLTSRTLFLVFYLAAPFIAPGASHLLLCHTLLRNGTQDHSAALTFAAICLIVAAVLSGVLYRQLAKLQRSAAVSG